MDGAFNLLINSDLPSCEKNAVLHFRRGSLDNQAFPLGREGKYRFGRDEACDFHFRDDDPCDRFCSRIHAELTLTLEGAFIAMIGKPSNGFFINGEKITDFLDWPLYDGDMVELGFGGPLFQIRIGRLSDLARLEENETDVWIKRLWDEEKSDLAIEKFLGVHEPQMEKIVRRFCYLQDRFDDCINDVISHFSTPGNFAQGAFWLERYDPRKGSIGAFLYSRVKMYILYWCRAGGMPGYHNAATGKLLFMEEDKLHYLPVACTSETVDGIVLSRKKRLAYAEAAYKAYVGECDFTGKKQNLESYLNVFPEPFMPRTETRPPSLGEVAKAMNIQADVLSGRISQVCERIKELLWWQGWAHLYPTRRIGGRPGLPNSVAAADLAAVDQAYCHRWGAILPKCRINAPQLPAPPPRLSKDTEENDSRFRELVQKGNR